MITNDGPSLQSLLNIEVNISNPYPTPMVEPYVSGPAHLVYSQGLPTEANPIYIYEKNCLLKQSLWNQNSSHWLS